MDSTLITRAISGIQSEGYSVIFEDPAEVMERLTKQPRPIGKTHGMTNQVERRVSVLPGEPEEVIFATLLHEWAHVVLHGPQIRVWMIDGTQPTPKAQQETEARLTAASVLQKLGIQSDVVDKDLFNHYLLVGMVVVEKSLPAAGKATRAILAYLNQREEVAA